MSGSVNVSGTSSQCIINYAGGYNSQGTIAFVAGLNTYPSVVVGPYSTGAETSTPTVLLLHRPKQASQNKGTSFGIGIGWYEDPTTNYPRTRVDFKTTGKTTDSSDPTNTVLTILDGGNVGIGKTNPTCSLDVSGSVKAITLSTGDVAFKVYKVTGTLAATGSSISVALPDYITYLNVISINGGCTDNGTVWLDFAWKQDANWGVSTQINGNSLVLFSNGGSVGGKAFRATIVYV